MNLPLRISTSPPTFGEHGDGDGSYYCDIYGSDDWEGFAIVHGLPTERKAEIAEGFLAGYRAMASDDREIGLLVCVDDPEDGMMYYGIDHAGVLCREPAANEALWSVANAAVSLPEGHRLSRIALIRSQDAEPES